MRSFLRSFAFAAKGIYTAVLDERNLRFHLCIALYVYVFSLFYDFDRIEYMILTLLVAGVLSLELVNSAFERSVSKPSPEKYQTAGTVKDIAAGAVLVFCIGAAVCGFILFWDVAVFIRIFSYFYAHPVHLILLLLSLLANGWFVFCFDRKKIPRKKDPY